MMMLHGLPNEVLSVSSSCWCLVQSVCRSAKINIFELPIGWTIASARLPSKILPKDMIILTAQRLLKNWNAMNAAISVGINTWTASMLFVD
ncbi:hypothetical protein LENED_008896 [Lentinula edodes]|uniref:Uncharacterized protein n=1 Tax=Lentinula edodes TaxID=5353 RepID=A0A1Q3EIC0_LENED|nr:hypothetical protein LENED_008896 [Lentinula edodes]